MKKKRMANMEVLRILAMMMVVMLHYLSKGQVLPAMTGPLGINGYVAWVLETMSIVAVNVYMLISGFFLTESKFRCTRLIQLVCQVLFYSLLVPVILMAVGVLSVNDLNLYKLLQYGLPVEMEQYWFAAAYVMLYLLTPILRCAVHHMQKTQLKVTIIILLLFWSVNKSLLPVRLTIDELGYDALWFVCVYLCAAYIRLYGIKWFDKAGKGVLGYVAGCAGILGITLVIRALYLVTGKFEDFLIATYHYNHILNLFAAISLFYAFYHWRMKDGWLAAVALKVAPYTFGVYLLHEQVEIRYLWPEWLGASAEGNPLWFVVRSILSVFVVFIVGVAADMVRNLIFAGIGKVFAGGRIQNLLTRLDRMINGETSEQTAERM